MRPHSRLLERLFSALLTSVPVLGCLWFCGVFQSRQDAHAGVKASGYWSKLDTLRWDSTHTADGKYRLISGGAVHMAVLRTNSDSTMVLHWEHGNQARLWLGAAMDTVGRGFSVPNDTFDVFCNGHAMLPDGRLLAVGGSLTYQGTVTASGENRNAIFDPISRSWQHVDTTRYGRWYPTVTALGNGTMLATAGTQWFNLVMFGGVKDATTTTRFNDTRFLNRRPYENWGADPETTVANRPPVRSGHSAVLSNGFTVIFGGESTSITPKNDVWALFGDNTNRARFYKWNKLNTYGDPAMHPDSFPAPRSRHSAIAFRDSLLIFGGKDANGNALGDVWRLHMKLGTSQGWWKKLNPTLAAAPKGPWPRFGHTAVLAKEDTMPVMVIYGGKNSQGTVVDSLWEMKIPTPGGGYSAYSWRLIQPNANAGKREGHSAVAILVSPFRSASDHRVNRLVFFGGQKETGALDNGVHELRLGQSGNATEDTNWTWKQTTIISGTPPSARSRHAAAYDNEFQRMLVFGGDTDIIAGGYVNDLWEATWHAPPNGDLDTVRWVSVTSDSVPEARWGHTLIVDPRPVESHVPELFDPSSTANGPGRGNFFENAAGPKYLPFYPFMFQLRDGNVFFAGNGPEHKGLDSSWIYTDPTSTSLAKWQYPVRSGSGTAPFLGGSAVFFPDQDKVMKCGGDDDINYGVDDVTRTAVISGSSTTWTTQSALSPGRTFHNLTALPDGRVLLTGGFRRDTEVHVRAPRIWDPADGTWGSGLENDPFERGYHSTATLLPDARILCSAGRPSLRYASVYSPPYLYTAADALATRPSISSYPTHTVHYAEPLYVDIGNVSVESIAFLSLIRPGAATHGFDQSQRYVKLTPTVDYGKLRAVLPDAPNHVPPGDYMVFAVQTGVGGVPSVAKWIRVASETDNTKPLIVYDLEYGPGGWPITYRCWWTTPGDDGGGPGAATGFQLRQSSSEITNQNWASASLLASGVAPPAGYGHVVDLGSTCTDGYFAVRYYDERNNWGDVSYNWGSSCDGGGLSANKVGRDAILARKTDPAGGLPTSYRRAAMLPNPGGDRKVAVSWVNPGPDSLRPLGFQIVGAYDSGDTVTLAAEGGVGLGIRRSLHRAWSSRAGNVTSRLTSRTADYSGTAGETLVVYRQPGEATRDLWIEISGPDSENGPSRSGIEIQIPSSEGWKQFSLRFPGAGKDARLEPDVFQADSVRLVLRGGYSLRALEGIEPISGASATRSLPVRLVHSRMGAVSAGSSMVVRSGEHITVTFDDTLGASPHRLFSLIEVSTAMSEPVAQGLDGKRTLPAVFALGQSEPNPFGVGTVIRFALPVRSQVAIEIFDISGRRVRTLTRSQWQAGYHSVSWDGLNERNRRVHPGIYLYRMTAGSFRASRKLSFLP